MNINYIKRKLSNSKSFKKIFPEKQKLSEFTSEVQQGKNTKVKKISEKQGFTLVELIIVIAIIAVLATSAFMMLTKWLSRSRDARRLSDLDVIHKSLEIWLVDMDNTSSVDPMPDDSREVSLDGTIWYQGIVGTGVVEMVPSLVKTPIDPNGQYYVYSLMKSNKKIYQVATLLEHDIARLTNGVLAIEWTNKVEWTFESALYKTNLSGGNCGVVYLPSIVVAPWVTDIDPVTWHQYFVLDGDTNNLLYGWTTMKNYKDIVSVSKDIDIVWSGTCNTDLDNTTVLSSIATNLDGMIPLTWGQTVNESLVRELLATGGAGVVSTSSTNAPSNGGGWITPATYFTAGNDYTQYWSGTCDPSSMTTEEIESWTDKIPALLTWNTLYVLKAGTHTTTRQIEFNGNCIWLVGSGNVTIEWTSLTSVLYSNSNKSKNIIANLTVDGKGTSRWIYTQGTTSTLDFTIQGVTIIDPKTTWISVFNPVNSLFKTIEISNSNQVWFELQAGTNPSKYNHIENILVHDNGTVGLSITVAQNYSRNNYVYNINSYDNLNKGIYIFNWEKWNISKLKSYNNGAYGIELGVLSGSTIKDITTYNNSSDWLSLYKITKNNIINNVLTYNNDWKWIDVSGSSSSDYDEYTSLNNVNVFNNQSDGINFSLYNRYIIFNNVFVYNNGYSWRSWIRYDSSTSYTYLYKVKSYNNVTYWIEKNGNNSYNHDYYYGDFILFDNDTNIWWTGLLSGASTDTVATDLWWVNWNLLENTETFSGNENSWTTVPSVAWWDNTFKWRKTGLTFDGNETYTYGTNIASQVKPIRWNGTNWEYYGVDGTDYNTGKKIWEW